MRQPLMIPSDGHVLRSRLRALCHRQRDIFQSLPSAAFGKRNALWDNISTEKKSEEITSFEGLICNGEGQFLFEQSI